MTIKGSAWAVVYSMFEITQGLLIHPYQTMRQLVRERVFAWMVFSPIFLWVFSLFVWRVIEVLLFSMIPHPTFWIFLALWFTVGIGMYQALLVYFLVRFWNTIHN